VVLVMLVVKPNGLFGEKLARRSEISSSRPTTSRTSRLFKHGGQRFWYGAAGRCAAGAAPWLLPEYWLSQLTFI
jgi:hypothetical protein